jgi:hypothetical protein
MKNTIFLVAMACLLAGCAGNTKPDFKVAVQGSEKQTPPLKITTEPNLPVKIDIQSDKGLPVENEALQVSFKPSKANWVAIILGGLAALFTLLSAGGAWWAAYNTKKAAEGRLFFELMSEYATEGMHNDVRSLCRWGRENNKNLEGEGLKEKAQNWIKSLNSGDVEADKIDLSHRHVTYFFDTLSRLQDLKYIEENLVKGICEGMSPRIIDIILALGEAKMINIGVIEEHDSKSINERVERLKQKLEKIKNKIDE